MKVCALPEKLDLRGVFLIIPGIIAMLVPLHGATNAIVDMAAYLLIAAGLFWLHVRDGGFGLADVAAIGCVAMSALTLFVELGHVGAVIPLLIYCLVLYFMCHSFVPLADAAGDHHAAHHFITHMWVDIAATLFEVVIHLLDLPEWANYVTLAIVVYCEAMLIMHMYRFYRHYNGKNLCAQGH